MQCTRDAFVSITHCFWRYLESLDCRLTKLSFIHWSIPLSLVFTPFSSTKSFKSENMSWLFPSTFLSYSPINAFTLSIAMTTLVSLVCMSVFHALNFTETSLKFANIEKIYSLPKCSACARFLLPETVLLVLAGCEHEPQNISSWLSTRITVKQEWLTIFPHFLA
jgi:hypothetical protein